MKNLLFILSEEKDISINIIIDYLLYNGYQSFVRFNTENNINKINIQINNKTTKIIIANDRNTVLNINDIKKYFFRRGVLKYKFLYPDYGNIPQRLELFINNEINILFGFIHNLLEKKSDFIAYLADFNTNKLQQLENAKNCKFLIPDTLITSEKKELINFIKEKRSIIKPIGDHVGFATKNKVYNPKGTLELKVEELKNIPNQFFPTLVQELIEKEYEIRVFFIKGKIFSMAIFSQSDSKTKLDFRNYNYAKMNRFIPYKLDQNIENKLKCFMKVSGYDTGSIDLIKGKNGEIYFLEINLFGQFSWLSEACNYFIEKEIAKLILTDL